jgi:NAD(P)-dependent dehydrogenase (short-subunit alcohol dehydrogenase family)
MQDFDRLAIAEMSSPFGTPDILVNAAGLNLRQPADQVTAEGWRDTIHLNLTVPFFLGPGAGSGMREKGWGRIINFASLQSRRAFANGIAYGASKGGVEQLTRAMAEAWSRDGIIANALAPGVFPYRTDGAGLCRQGRLLTPCPRTCIGRNGEMADLEGPLMFLASDASAYVTGQVLFVDGGYTPNESAGLYTRRKP